MPNAAFWHWAFTPIQAQSLDAARVPWDKALHSIRAAIGDLELCRKEATANAELLDYFLFGARRMELRFQRELDRLQAVLAYRNARSGPWAEAISWVERSEAILRSSRDAHHAMSERFAELWNRENKPYALDWTLRRYDELIAKYNAELDLLARVRQGAKSSRSLPTPQEVGLEWINTVPAKSASR